jgi:hypothetical protein
MKLVINAKHVNFPLALVAREDGQLRPNHVELKDYILINCMYLWLILYLSQTSL